ncbi:DNA polymerase delta catalytic subunit [Coemansia sp. S146]|nr:DNA polymerase delta catalytic subunit [Coemansia sp. S146]
MCTGGPTSNENELSTGFEPILKGYLPADGQVGYPAGMWPRLKAPPVDPQTTNLAFQQMDIDYEYAPSCNAVAIRLFGVTETGRSVVCYVQGFSPYFYCLAPDGFKDEHVPQVISELNHLAQSIVSGGNSSDAVVGIEVCKRELLLGHRDRRPVPFLKISVRNPKLMQPLSLVVKRGFNVPGIGLYSATSYETSLDLVIRLMVDRGVVGAGWVELPAGKYSVRTKHSTFCQYEADIEYKDLVAHEPVDDWSKVAPLRILCVEIKCAREATELPKAKTDPVIQIANIITQYGHLQSFIRNVFTLDTCAPIPSVDILRFLTESEMLLKWSLFVQECDPDVIIGYNSSDFDLPYLLDRAKALCVTKFPFLGRIRDVATKVDSLHGTKVVTIQGRVHFDVLAAMRHGLKLDGYSLTMVSAKFFNKHRNSVPYSIVVKMQKESWETRRRMAAFCLRDAYLPQLLIDRLGLFMNAVESARVLGVPLNYLLVRGQSISAIGLLLRYSLRQGLVTPLLELQQGNCLYMGATTAQILHSDNELIATLCFKLLYKSTLITHNLCYTTLLNKPMFARLKLEQDIDYIETPAKDCFVKPTKRVGLLPCIIKELQEKCDKIEAATMTETDLFKCQVLNVRLLALKNSISAIYKFTGMHNGQLPCLPIPSSIKAFDSKAIPAAITESELQFIDAKAKDDKDYKHDAIIVYGGTNSLKIQLSTKTLEETMHVTYEHYVLGCHR